MADPTARALATTARPVDRLLGGYLLLTAGFLAFPTRPDAWPAILAAHVVLGAFLLLGGAQTVRRWSAPDGARGGRPGRRAVQVAAAWYPLLLMPFLYRELPWLIQAAWGGEFFDGVVMGWEEWLFGHQPSLTLAASWDLMPLSEALHLAYLAYYPVIYFLPAALFLRGSDEAFLDTVFAVMLGFTVAYVAYVAFPVQGPRYLFPAPAGEIAGGPLYRLTHMVLETGSSRGAAFPSSHAAVAVIQAINARRHLPSWAPALWITAAGLSIGAVYGRFHYGVDIIAGVVLGMMAGLAAPRIRGALR